MIKATTNAQKAEVALLKERIRKEPDFAVLVFQTIWDRQQPREKYYRVYQGSDGGRGFRSWETTELCELHDVLEDQSWMFKPGQMRKLQERTEPYAEQFWRSIQEPRQSPTPPHPAHTPTQASGGPTAPVQATERSKTRRRTMDDAEKRRIQATLEDMERRLAG